MISDNLDLFGMFVHKHIFKVFYCVQVLGAYYNIIYFSGFKIHAYCREFCKRLKGDHLKSHRTVNFSPYFSSVFFLCLCDSSAIDQTVKRLSLPSFRELQTFLEVTKKGQAPFIVP